MDKRRWRSAAEVGLLSAALAVGLGWVTGVHLPVALGVVLSLVGALWLSQILIAPPPAGTIPFPGPTRSRGVWVEPPDHILSDRYWSHPVVQDHAEQARAAA